MFVYNLYTIGKIEWGEFWKNWETWGETKNTISIIKTDLIKQSPPNLNLNLCGSVSRISDLSLSRFSASASPCVHLLQAPTVSTLHIHHIHSIRRSVIASRLSPLAHNLSLTAKPTPTIKSLNFRSKE